MNNGVNAVLAGSGPSAAARQRGSAMQRKRPCAAGAAGAAGCAVGAPHHTMRCGACAL